MAAETLEKRVEKLESKIQEVEERLTEQLEKAAPKKRGWRWFVGIDATLVSAKILPPTVPSAAL
jgi:hypothetical protein